MGDGWFVVQAPDLALAFLSILLEGLPFVLLGTLVSGAVDVFVPARWVERMLPRRPTGAVLVSGLLGCIFPVCECGIIPVIRRLMVKGLPVSCAVTYMLAAPIVNPIVAFSTFAAFRGQAPENMTCLRILLGYAVAVAVGFVVMKIPASALLRPAVLDAMAREPGSVSGTVSGPWLSRIRRMVETSARDFVDVAGFLVIGALLTALCNTSVPQQIWEPLAENAVAAVFGMMALAFVLGLCSSSDAFIAATFFAFPPAAKLAFLVFGPMMDVKLAFLYATTFRRRWVVVLAMALLGMIGVCCLRAGRVVG
jgi:uncharacterized membrane protein YraQ (UPF0718 family)